MEQQKIEADIRQAARRDLINDYRKFLDAQKFGNATLKEQMLDPEPSSGLQGNRRFYGNTMLPPR